MGGLEPLRHSTVLEDIDVRMGISMDAESCISSIVNDITTTEGNAFKCLRVPLRLFEFNEAEGHANKAVKNEHSSSIYFGFDGCNELLDYIRASSEKCNG